MSMSMALVLGLCSLQAQTGDLELTNIRSTYGALGPTRPEGKLIPGDTYHVAFDIENVKLTEGGEAQYSMAMEVTDAKNKVHFKQDPVQLTSLNTFGGRSLPGIAHVGIGRDQPPGQYTLKVTVTDRSSNKSKSFSRPLEVAAPAFGLVRLNITADYDQRIPTPAIAVPGQSLWVHLFAVEFKRGGPKDEPDLAIEMRVFDDKNQPTLPKPMTGEFKELPKETVALPMQFQLVPNRPGKFVVKLKATDRVANKTAELSFPITVLEPK
jgi:hypothetical protein